jgi:putative endonuclease
LTNTRRRGSGYEQAAADFLMRQGYEILEMNYRIRQGEIDIIAREDGCIVFVEVKYRAKGEADALSAVDFRKQRKISRVALTYITRHRLSQYTPYRFDVIAVTDEGCNLIKNAYDYNP